MNSCSGECQQLVTGGGGLCAGAKQHCNPGPLGDGPRMDHFREHRGVCSTDVATGILPGGAAPHKEEYMDQIPQLSLEELEDIDNSESSEHALHHDSLRCCSQAIDSWADHCETQDEELVEVKGSR